MTEVYRHRDSSSGVTAVPDADTVIDLDAIRQDGVGCHAGKAEMRRAAATAGKSETLARYAADYPAGPHDQPQSMCPASAFRLTRKPKMFLPVQCSTMHASKPSRVP